MRHGRRQLGSVLAAAVVFAVAGAGAPPADARTTALARVPLDPDRTPLAVDSGHVALGLAGAHRSAVVGVAPPSGGPLVGVFHSLPRKHRTRSIFAISAAGGRLGFVVADANSEGDLLGTSAWLGGLIGSYGRVTGGPTYTSAYFPLALTLGGSGYDLTEASGSPRRVRVRVFPDGRPARRGVVTLRALAGNLIAYGAGDKPARFVVADIATGAIHHTAAIPGGDVDEGFDLAPDGRIVFVSPEHATRGIWTLDATGRPSRITTDKTDIHSQPHFAGDTIVAVRRNPSSGRSRVVALSALGSRNLSPPAEEIGGLDADAGKVAWVANRCAVSTDLLEAPATGIPAGPCARSVIAAPDGRLTTRGLRVRVACLTSDTHHCRGTVSGRKRVTRRPARFAIPVGRSRTVTVRLTPSGRRLARRVAREEIDQIVTFTRAVSTDAAGRRYALEFLTGAGGIFVESSAAGGLRP